MTSFTWRKKKKSFKKKSLLVILQFQFTEGKHMSEIRFQLGYHMSQCVRKKEVAQAEEGYFTVTVKRKHFTVIMLQLHSCSTGYNKCKLHYYAINFSIKYFFHESYLETGLQGKLSQYKWGLFQLPLNSL